MNNQEFFNIVWERAKDHTKAEDGIPGTTAHKCLYRAPNGKKCFVGAAIPDEEYKKEMDEPMFLTQVLMICPSLKPVRHELVRDCQRIHDLFTPSCWTEKLVSIASQYNLEVPVG